MNIPHSILLVLDARLLPIQANDGLNSSQPHASFDGVHFFNLANFSFLSSQSTKVLNLVISSNISCRSTSVILFVRLGIKVLASSALSQHKLAAPPTRLQPSFIAWRRRETRWMYE